MGKKIDELFIRLAELYRSIEENGNMMIEAIEEKDVVDQFYNKAINMTIDGRIEEQMDIVLSFELLKTVRDRNLDDESIKCMLVIKKLIGPIRRLEYDNILYYANIWAGDKVCQKINDEILYKYIAKDYENSEHQEICSMKFYDEIEIDR